MVLVHNIDNIDEKKMKRFFVENKTRKRDMSILMLFGLSWYAQNNGNCC